MAENWGVELLRLTLFSDRPFELTDPDWEGFVGSSESYRRENLPAGGRRYTGPFLGGELTIASVGTRCDVILRHSESNDSKEHPEASLKLPTIAAWDDLREEFVGRTSRWLDEAKNRVNRIAFGAVLLSPKTSRDEAYLSIAGLLGSVKVDPERMSELLFRVNWPRVSKTIEGLRLNRLTAWSSIELRQVVVQVSDGGVAGGSTQSQGLHAVRLEIDYNSDPAHKEPFDQSCLIPIYRELVEMASETAVEGERP